MTSLKVTTIGNSVGVVLSKEILTKLRVDKGDTLYAIETPNGIELSAYNPEFAAQMDAAESIMREDRDVLKKLRRIMPEPVWILEYIAKAIHKRQIAEHGGAYGMRDEGLLLSALAKPKNLYNYADPKPDISAMAASYAYGITRKSPVCGWKQTYRVCCLPVIFETQRR